MYKHYYELLKICGYEDEEIERETARIEEAFLRLDLGPEDMKVAEKWVKQNHDVELIGVRKLLCLWIKELVDLVLARDEGKRLVYYGFPTIAGPAAAIAASSDEIYCVCPDALLAFTMGQIFHKINHILEAGERNGLPPGHSLCSLQQVRVGGMAMGIIPVPDIVLTSSYYCDMGSKTDELIHERYGHPAAYVDGSMDSRWGQFPNCLPERVAFLGGELNKALDKVGEMLGVEITKEVRYKGASCNREIRDALNELAILMRDTDPQPISMVESDLARRFTSVSASKRVINESANAVYLLIEEVKERISKGIGVVEKGAPRIAILFSHFADPSITRMMESSGLAIPVSLLELVTAKFKKSPDIILGEVVAQAEMELGIFEGNYAFIKRATEAIQGSKIDGFIWNYLYNCHPLTQMSHLLKQFVERETEIPVLSLESDLVDSRVYNAATQRTKVETFAEILRARKALL